MRGRVLIYKQYKHEVASRAFGERRFDAGRVVGLRCLEEAC
jgi:hypothetical protein